MHPKEKCKICMKKVTHYKRHLNIHTREKTYKCKFCSMEFVRSDNLNDHVKKHSRETYYICDICDGIFTAKVKLQRHKIKRHSSNITTANVKKNEKVEMKNNEILGDPGDHSESFIYELVPTAENVFRLKITRKHLKKVAENEYLGVSVETECTTPSISLQESKRSDITSLEEEIAEKSQKLEMPVIKEVFCREQVDTWNKVFGSEQIIDLTKGLDDDSNDETNTNSTTEDSLIKDYDNKDFCKSSETRNTFSIFEGPSLKKILKLNTCPMNIDGNEYLESFATTIEIKQEQPEVPVATKTLSQSGISENNYIERKSTNILQSFDVDSTVNDDVANKEFLQQTQDKTKSTDKLLAQNDSQTSTGIAQIPPEEQISPKKITTFEGNLFETESTESLSIWKLPNNVVQFSDSDVTLQNKAKKFIKNASESNKSLKCNSGMYDNAKLIKTTQKTNQQTRLSSNISSNTTSKSVYDTKNLYRNLLEYNTTSRAPRHSNITNFSKFGTKNTNTTNKNVSMICTTFLPNPCPTTNTNNLLDYRKKVEMENVFTQPRTLEVVNKNITTAEQNHPSKSSKITNQQKEYNHKYLQENNSYNYFTNTANEYEKSKSLQDLVIEQITKALTEDNPKHQNSFSYQQNQYNIEQDQNYNYPVNLVTNQRNNYQRESVIQPTVRSRIYSPTQNKTNKGYEGLSGSSYNATCSTYPSNISINDSFKEQQLIHKPTDTKIFVPRNTTNSMANLEDQYSQNVLERIKSSDINYFQTPTDQQYYISQEQNVDKVHLTNGYENHWPIYQKQLKRNDMLENTSATSNQSAYLRTTYPNEAYLENYNPMPRRNFNSQLNDGSSSTIQECNLSRNYIKPPEYQQTKNYTYNYNSSNNLYSNQNSNLNSHVNEFSNLTEEHLYEIRNFYSYDPNTGEPDFGQEPNYTGYY